MRVLGVLLVLVAASSARANLNKIIDPRLCPPIVLPGTPLPYYCQIFDGDDPVGNTGLPTPPKSTTLTPKPQPNPSRQPLTHAPARPTPKHKAK